MDKQLQGHRPIAYVQAPAQAQAPRRGIFKRDDRQRPEEELQRWTFTWMAMLPKHLRPLRLGARYARIANRLAAVWSDEKTTSLYLDSLLLDQRGDRKGFSASVAGELRQLDGFNKSRRNDDESAWDFVRETLSPRS